VLAAPAVSRAKGTKESAHEHTGTVGASRHSPHNGFTAYAVLSLATNSSCHHHRRIDGLANPVGPAKNLRRLDTSNGCRNHTVLPYAKAPFVCRAGLPLTDRSPPCDSVRARHCRVHRISPTCLTIRIRPLVRDETAGVMPLIWGAMGSGIFFSKGLDRANHVEMVRKISLSCRRSLSLKRRLTV
jgi:hypothetical protein